MQARILCGIIVLVCSSCSQAYIVDGSRVSQPRLLAYTSKLDNLGTLEQNAHGITYLRVPEAYIAELLQRVKLPGFEIPSYDIPDAAKATHISIIDSSEKHKVSKLSELGKTIQFKPLGFYTVVYDDQEFLMLAVDAPELSDIRQKYGLPDKFANHAFNIMIGVRRLTAENEMIDPATFKKLKPSL